MIDPTPLTPRNRRRGVPTALVAGVALLLLALGAEGASSVNEASSGFDGSTWRQGAQGLFGAIAELKKQADAPMVVYFYTDWCGYCRQFEREILGTEPVKEYFGDLLAVRINPESGAQEREIAEYYGVSGYPAFFVHSGRSKTLSRIERLRLEAGKPRLLTPDEFIAAVRSASAR